MLLTGVQFLVTPWTVAYQAPLSLGFSSQEYWSGLPCPPPGDLPNPGIETLSVASPGFVGGCLGCHLGSPARLCTHLRVLSVRWGTQITEQCDLGCRREESTEWGGVWPGGGPKGGWPGCLESLCWDTDTAWSGPMGKRTIPVTELVSAKRTHCARLSRGSWSWGSGWGPGGTEERGRRTGTPEAG